MRVPRSIGLGAATVLLLAACGGGPGAATQGPAGATTDPGGGDGGGATPAPQVTTDPGGGGGGGGGSGGGGTGNVKFDVTGPIQRSGDLPFFAFGSRFSGAAGVGLNFTKSDDESGDIFTISEVNGAHALSSINEDYAMSWADCETFELNVNGNNATGRFDCDNGVATKTADGSFVTGLKITGTFEAHG